MHITMTPERQTDINRILVAQFLSNLQSFTKVQKSGTLSQYQLLLQLVFSPLRKNVGVLFVKSCIGQAALTQHHIFYIY